jgi:hypothetical protein
VRARSSRRGEELVEAPLGRRVAGEELIQHLGPVNAMGRHAPGQGEALGKARRAARAGRPGKRRNAAQRLALPRPFG